MYVSICVRAEMPAKQCLIKKKPQKNPKMDTMNAFLNCRATSEGKKKTQFRDLEGLDKAERNGTKKK